MFSPQLDFQLASEEGDTGSFIPNGEWALLGNELPNNSIVTLAFLPKVRSLQAFAWQTKAIKTQNLDNENQKNINVFFP